MITLNLNKKMIKSELYDYMISKYLNIFSSFRMIYNGESINMYGCVLGSFHKSNPKLDKIDPIEISVRKIQKLYRKKFKQKEETYLDIITKQKAIIDSLQKKIELRGVIIKNLAGQLGTDLGLYSKIFNDNLNDYKYTNLVF